MSSNFNPHVSDLQKRLSNKYGKLKEHNRADETGWTGAGVFLLHAIIGLGTCSIITNFNLSKIEGIALSVLALGLSIVIEFLKSRYQERYLIFQLLENDEKLPIDKRTEAYHERLFNGKILGVIYLISAAFFIANGVLYAIKITPSVSKIEYDISIKTAYDAKVKNVSYAMERGVKIAKIKELQGEADDALNKWNLHKSSIDAQNQQLNGERDENIMIYSILAIGICVLLELSLFGLRKLHEAKQYKIAQSIKVQYSAAPAAAAEKKDDSKDDLKKLYARIEAITTQNEALNKELAAVKRYVSENP